MVVVVHAYFWEDAWLLVAAGQGETQKRDSETWRDSPRASEGETAGESWHGGGDFFRNTSVSFFQRKLWGGAVLPPHQFRGRGVS